MADRAEDTVQWDETVDVICVGTGPGVLAYAICCAAADLDILFVHPPVADDEHTDAWFEAVTADLDAADDECPQFSFARVVPHSGSSGKREKLETFVGEHLRQWSAHCLRSPLGVIFTQVSELLIPMRTEDGATITAAFLGDLPHGDVLTWLADRAREAGVPESGHPMSAMILEQGRIAGVELDDGTRVAATGGLVFPVGAHALVPDLPGLGDCTVAVVGRPAGRFATVELLLR